jgi:hypothetical protein
MPDRNSKRTRIEPVFTTLARIADRSWAQRLLDLSHGIQAHIETGAVSAVSCENEPKVAPSRDRLAWMLRNWRRLAPSDGSKYRELVERMSDQPALQAALRQLEAGDVSLPPKMILEGPTYADRLIECERAVVWVEGKRDDWMQPGTTWDVGRDQLARDLEAAWIFARRTGREDYCLIIAYEEELRHHEVALINAYRNGTWSAGWPHLDEHQRQEFATRIGTIRWCQIAEEWPEIRELPALMDLASL